MKILLALIKKEFYQIVRDPSSIMIAFILPFIILIIYMYGINLDTLKIATGVKVEDEASAVSDLTSAFNQNKYMQSTFYNDRQSMYKDLVSTKIRGAIIIPNDFYKNIKDNKTASIQVITDGSEVNLANYVQAYPKAIIEAWLAQRSTKPPQVIQPIIRFWYNQDVDSHHFVLPGSLAITMTLIGMLLTALVVAREWERGTMEAVISTRARKIHLVLGKYLSYFILGMLSMAFNVFLCVSVFKVPFEGNYLVLATFSGLFLFTALGQGLLISTVLKSQFTASQAALVGGFLPSLMLSGLIYPIASMPRPVQFITTFIPSKYFVSCLQSEFLAGTIWNIVIPNSFFMFTYGLILFILVHEATQMRLD